MYAEDNSRYFMLGANYFRGAFSDGVTAKTLKNDLQVAVASGLNTVRVYGILPETLTQPDILQVLRELHASYGLRLLVTLECYKGARTPSKDTKAAVIAAAASDAAKLKGESWVLGFDLCNEPDDQYDFPGAIIVANNQSLWDIFPDSKDWGLFVKYQCGGWSTTFSNCKALPVDTDSMPAKVKAAYDSMSSMWGEYLSWRIKAIKQADPNRLLTVGHNAEHQLLPSNQLLDFISHHSYPSNPANNISCTNATFEDVIAMPNSVNQMNKLNFSQPITFGEFGTKTTRGLWPLLEEPLPIEQLRDSACDPQPKNCAYCVTYAVCHKCPITSYCRSQCCPSKLAVSSNTKQSGRCAAVGFDSSALWDSLTFLQLLKQGADGGLKWALFEKPWSGALLIHCVLNLNLSLVLAL